MIKDLDLFSKLSPKEQDELIFSLYCVNPLDGKYRGKIKELMQFISPHAEWSYCARVQLALVKGLRKFGKAEDKQVAELESAMDKIVPANISLLEDDPRIRHDQIAVLLELSRYVSAATRNLIHPGTTSYDILDTARNWMFRDAWKKVMRPVAVANAKALMKLAESEEIKNAIQVGRTHNQHTSPIYFSYSLSCYAMDLVKAIKRVDHTIESLEGKVAGITGSGASVAEFVGLENLLAFEQHVIEEIIGLPLCTNPTQVINKGNLANFGFNVLLLHGTYANMANTFRLLYSSEIGEVVSVSAKDRLGGSSADAGKNNPINWENIAGQYRVAQGGVLTLLAMTETDHQRDLRGSVQARYEPQRIMAHEYEAALRTQKGIADLYVVQDNLIKNLGGIRAKPTEALTGILKAHLFEHPEYGGAHESVKEWAKAAQREKTSLLFIALRDPSFAKCWSEQFDERQREILSGKIERYAESCAPRTARNLEIVDAFE
ncbi:hypothetical protein KY310_00370 [Candidatus Woesearchaeota archaeon]|nr:hypothetical protein [Candidatus Woesearchaeota archaeon]